MYCVFLQQLLDSDCRLVCHQRDYRLLPVLYQLSDCSASDERLVQEKCGMALGIACCGTSIGSGVFQALSGMLITAASATSLLIRCSPRSPGYCPARLPLQSLRSKPEDVGLKAYGQEEYDKLVELGQAAKNAGYTLKQVAKCPSFTF